MAKEHPDANLSIVALVPMRHTSERIPGKNYRLFAGQPLFHYILRSLLACQLISQVVVDTDSDRIKDEISSNFSEIKIIDRPDHLKAGTVPMNAVLLNDVKKVKADYYLQTHSTNPLLLTKTISIAIEVFLENRSIYDSLFSVTRTQVRLWDGLTRPLNHNPAILLRTQDLPPVYEENSCLYIFTRKTLESTHNRIGQRPLMYEIDRLEALDIDDELDFSICEYLYKEHFAVKG